MQLKAVSVYLTNPDLTYFSYLIKISHLMYYANKVYCQNHDSVHLGLYGETSVLHGRSGRGGEVASLLTFKTEFESRRKVQLLKKDENE